MKTDPNAIKVSYVRFSIRHLRVKHYRAAFQSIYGAHYSRRTFKTATQALTYGKAVSARYRRLAAAMPSAEAA